MLDNINQKDWEIEEIMKFDSAILAVDTGDIFNIG